MYWANFLHIYQPPTQTKQILERVVNESYRRIVAELKKAPQAKLTLNITGCLTELLDEHGFDDVIADLRALLERGQIELTGSAKYHPLLPKIPKKEAVRQIQLDYETNRHYFGEHYKPRGFFPPEAAYDREIAQIVADLGFEWILVEELSYSGTFGAVKYDRCYEIDGIETRSWKLEAGKEAGSWKLDDSSFKPQVSSPASSLQPPASRLKIFFRERDSSFKILSGQLGTIKLFEDYLGERLNRNEYLLTAMDGETFGHHRPGMEKLLFEIYKSQVPTVTISQLLELFPKTETVKTIPSTWALMEKDIEKNAPFSRWDDPENEIHRLQWELTRLAIDSVKNSRYGSERLGKLGEPERQNVREPDKSDVPEIRNSGSLTHRRTDAPSRSEFSESPDKGQQWLKARQLLDRSLHSDQYWWASARPWWSLEMIERGANELCDTVQAVPDLPEADKQRAQELYYQIITLGFEWQRSGKVEEMARREDEEIRERTDEALPRLPAEEIDKMIVNIRREMLQVAKKREYERAAQLRDRIKELEEYKNAA